MLAGSPPFILSDAFPGNLLPLPVAVWLTGVPADRGKSLKRARWIARDDFVSLITGAKQAIPWDRLLSDRAVSRCDTRRHNTLARDSDASLEEGGLFSRSDTRLRSGSGADHLTLYFRAADEQAADLFLGLLYELALTGFGADIATGRGQFDVLGDPETIPDLDAPLPDANTLVCLSTFQPAPADPTDGFWEVFPKFGKLGPDLGLADVRKKTLIMFRPGACFRADPRRPFLGRALPMDLILPEASAADLRARGIKIIHPAFGLTVPATLDWGSLS
jgi:CRISPR-associated protein Csm4